MRTIILLAVLTGLATAVPHKRECRRPAPADAEGTAPSLNAIAAFGQGRQGWRTRVSNLSPTGSPIRQATISSAIEFTPTDVPVDDGKMTAMPVVTDGPVDDGEMTAVPIVTDVQASSVRPTTSASTGAISSAAPKPPAGGTDGSGLAINPESVKSFAGFLNGNLGWYTGWSTSPLPGTGDLEFVPQVWGEANVVGVADAAKSWNGVKYVLSFNEPDMTAAVGGTSMSPQLSATKHQEWTKALGGSYQIGAPAVARGSKQWMQDWLTACNGACDFDFVPFHFYGTDADQLIDYAKDFHATFGKPLWVTEWACIDFSNGYKCTEAEVKDFMKTAISWFRGEGSSIVHRWAFFGAFPNIASTEGNANGLENTDGSINDMGKYYISL